MFHFHAVIRSMLEHTCDELRANLKAVEATWAPGNLHFLKIQHDSKNTVEVYAGIEYKAYLPKRMNSFNVRFIEWYGDR